MSRAWFSIRTFVLTLILSVLLLVLVAVEFQWTLDDAEKSFLVLIAWLIIGTSRSFLGRKKRGERETTST